MKRILAFLFILCISSSTQIESQEKLQKSLYRMVENDVWGYMDKRGKTVIKPQFNVAGYFFSDSLAMVAKNGRFGFIDTKGTLVIPPKYDAATRFFDGIARVHLKGKPYFINTKGELLFEHDFKEIYFFTDTGFATVLSKDGKKGLIDRNGNIIIEPIYIHLTFFEKEGVVLVEKERRNFAVLDTKGNEVVPFNTYDRIDYFINGLAFVEYSTDEETDANDFEGFIDTTGKVVLKTTNQPWEFEYDEEFFSENIGVVELFKRNPDSITDWKERYANEYRGIIDRKGNIIKKDTSWREISNFQKGRAFVENKTSDKFRLIDTNGNYVGTHEFDQYAPTFNDEPSERFFENDEVYVSVDDAWGIINRDGIYTVPLTDISGDVNYDSFHQIGEYLVYYNDAEEGYLYGFCNLKTNVIVPPKYTAINFDTLHDDLIHVELNDTMIYLNQKGETVWKENSSTEELKPFNILAMNRGYFYASSPSVAELNGLGGWADSENQFQKAKKQSFPKNEFGISVITETIVPYYEKYKGHQLYVYNTTKDSIFFDAQDSRLYMNIQAKDEDGVWKDIEYLPSSWCGNSYHNVFLAKNSFWEFTIPKYEGAIPTKLRVKLLYKSDHEDEESQVLYSYEFDGSVNPAQFWYKGNYIPSGMMDPYYD